MAKLSKQQIKAHAAAVALLSKGVLTEDDRYFVLENWRASANHINSAAGAFFTPIGLARDFSIEVHGRRIVDLCAGIGGLARAVLESRRDRVEMVCVEINPDYAAVGRKVVPEAEWIVADILHLPDIGRFDCAISNPPFGSTKRNGSAPRYSGQAFEYHLIDIASDVADHGTFIIPQMSAPFQYSGRPCFEARRSDAYVKFEKQTGIVLEPNCGIDCAHYRDQWDGVAPAVEIVLADFTEARQRRAGAASPPAGDLFAQRAA